MKLRVQRLHLVKTLNHYNELLSIKFGPFATSEAIKELIRVEAKQLQLQISRREKTNSWQIPIQVIFNENGSYYTAPENENSILIID